MLVSYLGELGTSVSAPALVLCTHSPAVYREIYPADELSLAADVKAASGPTSAGGAGDSAPAFEGQLELQQHYQARLDFCFRPFLQ